MDIRSTQIWTSPHHSGTLYAINRIDMAKISATKQQDDETASEYLARLTEVHTDHCELDKLAQLSRGQQVDAWEAHLHNSFLNVSKD
ncbi:hypothetical protein SRHO_G00090530 [Serrasalmus rhombeus]